MANPFFNAMGGNQPIFQCSGPAWNNSGCGCGCGNGSF